MASAEEIGVTDQEWKEYKEKFSKSYKSNEEEQRRRNLYLQCKQKITEHNKKYEAGEVSYSQGINQFADMEPHEMRCCGVLKPKQSE